MEIPEKLRTFDFCITWEVFKAYFDWINEEYWLHHFEVIGEKRAIEEMDNEIAKGSRKP